MYASRYNLTFDISGNEKVIFNPLSGAMDIINESEYEQLEDIKNEKPCRPDVLEKLVRRGYVFENRDDEERELERIYAEFERIVVKRGERYVLALTYDCNLRCTYCFQDEKMRRQEIISENVLDKFFETVNTLHGGKETKPLISLFGGEPLMRGQRQEEIIKKIVGYCNDNDWDLVAVTNGVNLDYFSPMIHSIKQVQVTLDGLKKDHDRRRIFKDGSGSFDKIVRGIDKALEEGIPVVVRVNVDKENIEDLPEFADFINGKDWKDVYTYLAPVKSLGCMDYGNCLPEHKILEKVFEHYKKHPQTRNFHLAGWQGVDTILNLLERGELFPPQFKNCEGNIDMLAMDLYGDIYTCVEACGKKEFSVGRFYPELEFNEKLAVWRNRSIFNVGNCSDCNVNILCGGGCAILALDKTGSMYSSYCKPIRKALDLAIPHFLNDLKSRDNNGNKI